MNNHRTDNPCQNCDPRCDALATDGEVGCGVKPNMTPPLKPCVAEPLIADYALTHSGIGDACHNCPNRNPAPADRFVARVREIMGLAITDKLKLIKIETELKVIKQGESKNV